jgi:hypothetical protein
MLYDKIDTSRGEIGLILNQADVDDLASACAVASNAMRKPGVERNPALADRLGLLCALFMVAFEAVKPREVETNGKAR